MGSSNSFSEFNSLAIMTIPFWTIILQALVSGQPVCKMEKKMVGIWCKIIESNIE
jgi:hypothetical protein